MNYEGKEDGFLEKNTFERAKKFRSLEFLFVILSVTYLVIFDEFIGTFIILVIAFYFGTQYRCPYCNEKFDTG